MTPRRSDGEAVRVTVACGCEYVIYPAHNWWTRLVHVPFDCWARDRRGATYHVPPPPGDRVSAGLCIATMTSEGKDE